jgi:hypothetical protein
MSGCFSPAPDRAAYDYANQAWLADFLKCWLRQDHREEAAETLAPDGKHFDLDPRA